jgi:16S rRNA processing protein RimM
VVGRVGRPHGLDGSVHLDGHGGAVALDPGTRARVGDREAVIVERRGVELRPILRFDLASDRPAAELLRGAEVRVAAAALPVPEEDEYFHVDLIGCAVWSGDARLGEVADVLVYPANDVLEVRGEEGVTLIPFAADVVLDVDVAGRRIDVREGFL